MSFEGIRELSTERCSCIIDHERKMVTITTPIVGTQLEICSKLHSIVSSIANFSRENENDAFPPHTILSAYILGAIPTSESFEGQRHFSYRYSASAININNGEKDLAHEEKGLAKSAEIASTYIEEFLQMVATFSSSYQIYSISFSHIQQIDLQQ